MNLDLIRHYRNLVWFNFNRFKGGNYAIMRSYFAEVFVHDIEKFVPLRGKRLIDVGGGNGEFCRVLAEKRNCRAINLEPCAGFPAWADTVKGMAEQIPFKEEIFDVALFRGVLEHIPPEGQQHSLNEIYRVLKKGGTGYFVIPPWYNPHAGHALKPFHILPFPMAKFLRELIFRKKILANSYDEERLYRITFSGMQKMLDKAGFSTVATLDTHFRLHFLTRIPLLREILVPAVAFVVRKS